MSNLTIDRFAAGSGGNETRRGRESRALRVSASPCSRVSAGETLTRSSSLVAILDQSIVSGASFITSVFVGRVCGEQSLGLYSLAFTLLILVRGVQESLVLVPYTIVSVRFSSRRRAAYAGSALIHSGVAASISMLVVAVGAGALSSKLGLLGLTPVLWMLAALLPLMLLRELARKLLFAEFHVASALFLDMAVAGSQLALIAWLAVAERLSAVTTIAAIGSASGLASLAWLVMSRHRLRVFRRRIVADWDRNWWLGRWIFAEHVCGIANAYSPYWLLALLLGAAATGEFAAAMTIVLLLNPFIIGLGNLLGPTAARALAIGGMPELRRAVAKFTLRLAVMLLAFCLLVAAWGDNALAALYGQRYAGQGLVVTLLALGLAANAIGMGADSALRAVGRPRDTFFASLLALTATLTAGVCLTPTWNFVGAAGAILAGNVAGTLARWLAFARFSRAARATGATA